MLKKSGEKGLRGQSVIPWAGVVISLFLLFSTSLSDALVGLATVLLGLPIYFFYARVHIGELRTTLISEEETLTRNLERKNRPVARLVAVLRRLFGRIR